MLNIIRWELWYFNHWLAYFFYFTAGLIIIFAIASNKYKKYRKKIMIIQRLKEHSYITS